MKNLLGILFILVMNGAYASQNWEHVATQTDRDIYIESSSISKSGKYRKAWKMDVFKEVQISPHGEVRSIKSLIIFLCTERKLRPIQIHSYKDALGREGHVHSSSLSERNAPLTYVIPGSGGEVLLKRVCQ